MRTCQSCGKENPDDQDFCSCGEYLRWEPTGYMQAVTPEMAAEAAAAPPEPTPAPPPPAVHVTPAAPVQREGGNGNGHATAAPLPAVAPQPPSEPVARPVPKTL